MPLYLFGLLDMSNLIFIFEIFIGEQVCDTELFPHDLFELIHGTVGSSLCLRCGPKFWSRETLVRDVDMFHLRAGPRLGGPWGVVPRRFNPKYISINVRNLSYKFEHQKTHRIYQRTLEHTITS